MHGLGNDFVVLDARGHALDLTVPRRRAIADRRLGVGCDQLILIDEVLTPDSSRFWPVDGYQVGTSPPSFDKQFVRDYLETLDWNKQAPAPRLPVEIIDRTAAKYREALSRLTG
jgi:phosphoribosylaminoimidazole-succinocarboxamide synthase